MLTAAQLRAVIQQTQPFKRALSVLRNDWQTVNLNNPLMRELITIDDLQFAIALETTRSASGESTSFDPHDYGSVMTFIRQHEDELASGSKSWLLREFS